MKKFRYKPQGGIVGFKKSDYYTSALSKKKASLNIARKIASLTLENPKFLPTISKIANDIEPYVIQLKEVKEYEINSLNEEFGVLLEAFFYKSFILGPQGAVKQVSMHGDYVFSKKSLLEKARKIFKTKRKLDDAIMHGEARLMDIIYKSGAIRGVFMVDSKDLIFSWVKPTYKALTATLLAIKKYKPKKIVVDNPHVYKENMTINEFIEKFL